MGFKERRQKETDEIKGRIIAAASELFVKDGYTSVSMRKIAEKIEYSPTTIYNYFENKQEILFHLLEKAFSKFLNYLEKPSEKNRQSDPLIRLKAILEAYIQFGLDHPNDYELIFVNNIVRFEEGLPIIEGDDRYKGFELLVATVKECIEQGYFKETDEMMVSQGLWAVIHGITSLFITFDTFKWEDKERLVHHLIDTHTNGLLKD